jgi:hypothetical protein
MSQERSSPPRRGRWASRSRENEVVVGKKVEEEIHETFPFRIPLDIHGPAGERAGAKAAVEALIDRRSRSLDHLARLQQDRFRNGEAEQPRRLQVDEQVELRGLLHRQLGRVGSLQDLGHVGGGPSVRIDEV